jgi:isopentenyldiphosphate isomerase
MPEMLDIYDDNLTRTGTKARPAVHRDGDWHRVFHCRVIFRDDDGRDWMIYQKRGADVATFPGLFDTSAAGHYEAGETVEDGLRELREELGLTPAFSELIPAGKRVSMMQSGAVIDREVADVFFYVCNQPLSAYAYSPDEVAGLIALNVSDGLELFTGQRDTLQVPAAGLGSKTVIVRRSDFVPAFDHYHEKALLLARRCLNHEAYLFI